MAEAPGRVGDLELARPVVGRLADVVLERHPLEDDLEGVLAVEVDRLAACAPRERRRRDLERPGRRSGGVERALAEGRTGRRRVPAAPRISTFVIRSDGRSPVCGSTAHGGGGEAVGTASGRAVGTVVGTGVGIGGGRGVAVGGGGRHGRRLAGRRLAVAADPQATTATPRATAPSTARSVMRAVARSGRSGRRRPRGPRRERPGSSRVGRPAMPL